MGLGWLAALGLAAAAVGYRPVRRMEVEGTSMAPTLLPGDRLLIVRAPRWWRVSVGAVVAVPDPRLAGRTLLKRVAGVGGSTVTVAGDNPAASTDSRHFGPLPRQSVVGPVLYRYAPRQRAGRLQRR